MLPRSHPVQILLFSATFPDHVRNFASKFAPNSNKIELKKNELSVDSIKQFYLDCKTDEAKYDILVQLYGVLTVGQSIIFCQVIDEMHLILLLLTTYLAPSHSGQNLPAYDRRRA